MNKDNLAFLDDNLKYLGFGEHSLLNQLLEAEMTRGSMTFDLYTEAFFDEYTRLEVKLYFRAFGIHWTCISSTNMTLCFSIRKTRTRTGPRPFTFIKARASPLRRLSICCREDPSTKK